MSEHVKLKRQKLLLLALKTAIGGSAAIYIAEKIGLQFAPSAGIIAMLSLVSTKWGTLKLSLLRVLTFLMSVALCWGIFHLMSGKWIEFGIFLFFLILICDKLGWQKYDFCQRSNRNTFFGYTRLFGCIYI